MKIINPNSLKISLCIPQYNRIDFLVKNLKTIEQQFYPNLEIIISDDCSSDNTDQIISKIIPTYRYPIKYRRNQTNRGYDFNLRQSMQMATGDYCFILGNDDTLNGEKSIEKLVDFLQTNDCPEIGFCNFIEDHDHSQVIERAAQTAVIGHGYECALKYYRSFSFVAGIIIKRESFVEVDTDRFDGSIYVQMYLSAKIIASGKRFFMIKEPLILKDLIIGNSMANSYRDTLPRKWSEFKLINGGIPAVVKVGLAAFSELGYSKSKSTFEILKGIYKYSYTYWLLDYRNNKSIVGALGFVKGLYPKRIDEFMNLRITEKTVVFMLYYFSTFIGLLTPLSIFNKLKLTIYRLIKK